MSKKEKKAVTRSIVPIGDKVLLKELKEEKKTTTGIILPESMETDKALKQATVIAVGEGKYVNNELIALSVKKGDTVLYTWGEKIEFDGEEFLLVRESEIVAKIETK